MALDLTKAPPPPRRVQASQAAEKRAKTANEARIAARAEGLNGTLQIASIPLMFLGQPADVAALAKFGPQISHETAELAETDDKIASIVDKICAIGPYGGIIAAVMPLILQILVNHGRLPMHPIMQQVGVTHPDVLLAQLQRDALEQQRKMMQEQQDALNDIARMQQEMMEMAQAQGQEQEVA